jgi:hypothetical protein
MTMMADVNCEAARTHWPVVSSRTIGAFWVKRVAIENFDLRRKEVDYPSLGGQRINEPEVRREYWQEFKRSTP